MKTEFEFIEFGKANLNGYTLIEGFPGMGLVGTIAAKYIVDKTDFDYIGYIDSNAFMPIIRIHDGMPVRPARIYANRKRKLVILISEQVIPKQYASLAAKNTVAWIKSKGITDVISLSGVHASGEGPRNEMIYGIASNEKSKSLIRKYNLKEITEGITTGVTALMLLEMKNSKINAISILGDVQMSADYKDAAEVLRKLNAIIALNINVEPLLKEAKQIEKQLIQQLQKLRDTKDNTEKFETKTPLIT